MASARKRPRPEAEDNRAECPFTIRVVDPREKDQKKKKRRRTDQINEDDPAQKVNIQHSPFSPQGKFKTYDTMDLHYQVEPAKEWTEMTRYNSFVLNGVKYYSEGFVYVANDASIERQKAVNNNEPIQPRKKSDDDWVARILEIRASDEHHVYARVYWMYWPDELPAGTHDGKKIIHGRQPYHGVNELIASNHMDIINVVSVTSQATVNQWFEENEEEVQNALYWRQAFDVRTYELSSVDLVCGCRTPANPDKLLIGCTTEKCKIWMHEQCILDEALRKTYKRLGTDKPHIAQISTKPETGAEGTRPLSPSETAPGPEPSIDVKPEASGSDVVHISTKSDKDAPVAPEDSIAPQPVVDQKPASVSTPEDKPPKSDSPGKPAPTGKGAGRKPGRPRKNADSKSDNGRPWEGLFSATLRMTEPGPPLVEITDLRPGIVGGEKTWTETINCLGCGNQVN